LRKIPIQIGVTDPALFVNENSLGKMISNKKNKYWYFSPSSLIPPRKKNRKKVEKEKDRVDGNFWPGGFFEFFLKNSGRNSRFSGRRKLSGE